MYFLIIINFTILDISQKNQKRLREWVFFLIRRMDLSLIYLSAHWVNIIVCLFGFLKLWKLYMKTQLKVLTFMICFNITWILMNMGVILSNLFINSSQTTLKLFAYLGIIFSILILLKHLKNKFPFLLYFWFTL